MKLPRLNVLFLWLIALASPLLAGASESPEPGLMLCTGQSQKQPSLAETDAEGFPIILAAAGRDQCLGGCNSDRQSCVERCPGIDEGNVVDPKYAARKCKAACDEVLLQCKSGCPNN